MERSLGLAALAVLLVGTAAQAGNTPSNSSSNSSNGFYTRVDTIFSDDGRGRYAYERRFRGRDDYRAHGYRERAYRYRDRPRRWRGGDDDDD